LKIEVDAFLSSDHDLNIFVNFLIDSLEQVVVKFLLDMICFSQIIYFSYPEAEQLKSLFSISAIREYIMLLITPKNNLSILFRDN